jgi:hypothetical protein
MDTMVTTDSKEKEAPRVQKVLQGKQDRQGLPVPPAETVQLVLWGQWDQRVLLDLKGSRAFKGLRVVAVQEGKSVQKVKLVQLVQLVPKAYLGCKDSKAHKGQLVLKDFKVLQGYKGRQGNEEKKVTEVISARWGLKVLRVVKARMDYKVLLGQQVQSVRLALLG